MEYTNSSTSQRSRAWLGDIFAEPLANFFLLVYFLRGSPCIGSHPPRVVPLPPRCWHPACSVPPRGRRPRQLRCRQITRPHSRTRTSSSCGSTTVRTSLCRCTTTPCTRPCSCI